MSANELTLFAPQPVFSEALLGLVAHKLSLAVDMLSGSPGFSFNFSAQMGSGRFRLVLEYRKDDSKLIREIMGWEKPKKAYKDILEACKSSVSIQYREVDVARNVLLAFANVLEIGSTSKCLVDNGLGCLLKLDDVLECVMKIPHWSWEKEQFPELPGVATSEWQ